LNLDWTVEDAQFVTIRVDGRAVLELIPAKPGSTALNTRRL
jgi:hypothetical protein